MKPLSFLTQFILWQQSVVKSNFQEKELSHKCYSLVFENLMLLQLLLSIKNLTSGQHWELKAATLCICFDLKNFFAFESIAMHDLI